MLARVKTRGDAKRVGTEIDRLDDRNLRLALVEEGRARGAELPDEAVGWPGKRLVRRALARDGEAQVRRNPIAVDESFACGHCGREVPPGGRTARNHCPFCLYSLHVDVVPGDRAADCGGLLAPVGASFAHDTWTLVHRCERCGAERRVRALLDVDVPDDMTALREVAARG
ncbi:MAG: RNHCP domain-containing protein [Deltaproteobacteria bacterium]|nr:MAG: RNHCP domain-containing protein [Deltaproteobacteria bacterium]